MRKLITAVATATTLLAGSVIWKAEAAPAMGSMPPLTKSYSPFGGSAVGAVHIHARRADTDTWASAMTITPGGDPFCFNASFSVWGR